MPEAPVAAARLAAQLLTTRSATSPTEVVAHLLAVQGQDPRGFRLSVRRRSTGLFAADVDYALSTERSVIVTWLNRGTLHLVTADDYWWLHPLTTPQLVASSQRRLRQEGVSEANAEQGVELVLDTVMTEGPQTRAQLRERLDDAGIPTAGQAIVHILLAASIHGDLVRGPIAGTEQAFVSARCWLGPPPAPLDRDEALGRLAQRYLVGHSPATAADLSKWAGITLTDARRAFDLIRPEVVDVDGGMSLASPVIPSSSASALPPPRLLGPFDPILHGWASRQMFVGAHGEVVTRNGTFLPTALVDGRVVAKWRIPNGAVSITMLEDVDGAVIDALVDDARDVLRFLGLPEQPAVVA